MATMKQPAFESYDTRNPPDPAREHAMNTSSGFLLTTQRHVDEIRAYLGSPPNAKDDEKDNEIVFSGLISSIEKSYNEGGVFVWVDPDSAQVKGFIEGDPKTGLVHRIEVWPEWRRKKTVGPALLAGFIERATKDGAFGLHGECRWKSVPFWCRNGFGYEVGSAPAPSLKERYDQARVREFACASFGIHLYKPLPAPINEEALVAQPQVRLTIELSKAYDDICVYTEDTVAVRQGEYICLPCGWTVARSHELTRMRLCVGSHRTGWFDIVDDCGMGVDVQGMFVRISVLVAEVVEGM